MTPEDPNNPPEVIWVDHNMKPCKKSSTARRATYNKEYEVYVIDH